MLMIAGWENWNANYFRDLYRLVCVGWGDFGGFGGLTRRREHRGDGKDESDRALRDTPPCRALKLRVEDGAPRLRPGVIYTYRLPLQAVGARSFVRRNHEQNRRADALVTG
jgi:hypothetical protein